MYNRGTEKRKIFQTPTDHERFLALLYLCNGTKDVHIADLLPRGRTSWNLAELLSSEREESLVDLCAYCLMPNHFHLLVREHTEKGISRFMQKLSTAYTMYFNTRYARTGALFQGKYRAEHAEEDRYLKYLLSYIHLNPIKLVEPKWKENGIANRKRSQAYLENYRWSSFLDYCGEERVESRLVALGALPKYFDTPEDFKATVTEWLTAQQGYTRSNLV